MASVRPAPSRRTTRRVRDRPAAKRRISSTEGSNDSVGITAKLTLAASSRRICRRVATTASTTSAASASTISPPRAWRKRSAFGALSVSPDATDWWLTPDVRNHRTRTVSATVVERDDASAKAVTSTAGHPQTRASQQTYLRTN